MQYTNFRSSLASLVTTVFFGLSLLLPVFGVHAETTATKSDTSTDGTFNCFDLFKFGSVQVNLSSVNTDVVAGGDLKVTAKIENQNSYPIVDGSVYVKIYKFQDSDSDRKVNGDNLVDELYAVKKINLSANASTEETFTWKIPVYTVSGKYKIVSYFLSSEKFNIMGLPFTEDIHGAPLDFTVSGQDSGVFLDKNTVKVGGAPYRFIGIAKPLSASKPITIEATVVNKTKKDVTFPVTAHVYRWAQYESNSHRIDLPQLVSLKAGEKKKVSFSIDSKDSISFVSIESKNLDQKSVLHIRFSREGLGYPRINFSGLTFFPLKKNVENTMFVCAHVAGVSKNDSAYVEGVSEKDVKNKIVTEEQSRVVLTLSDDANNTIDTYEYNGGMTSNMMGFKSVFTPKASYKNLSLKTETYKDGVIVDSSVTKYDCNSFGSSDCSTPSVGQSKSKDSNSSALMISVVIGLLIIFVLIVLVAIKKKIGSKGMKVLAFIVLGFSSMFAFGFGVNIAHAETVTWNGTSPSSWQHAWVDGSAGSAYCYQAPGYPGRINPCYGVTAASVSASVNYGVQAFNNGLPISNGASVRPGDVLTFQQAPFNFGDINWTLAGGGYGTPSGYWSSVTPTCAANDYLWGNLASEGRYYTPLSVTQPSTSISVTGPVSGSGWGPYTVTGTGSINAVATFNATPGRMTAYAEGGPKNISCTQAPPYTGNIWNFTVPQQQIALSFGSSFGSAPTLSLSAIPSTITLGDISNLSWSSSNATMCTAGNAWSGSKSLSGTQSVSPGSAGTYTYDMTCTDTSSCPPPTPACTIQITAGGLGGGGMNGNYSLSLGWGISVNNSGGTSPCGMTVSPSESGLGAYSGPTYSAPAGGSIGEGPFKSVSNVSAPYNVSITAGSIVCPSGTSPVVASGLTASCSMPVGSCSVDGLGNTNCNINGCSDAKTIQCVGTPTICGGAPSVTQSATLTVNPLNNPPLASFDSADCSAFVGWSTDRDSGATPNDVWFIADGPIGVGTLVGSMTANNVQRPDVRSYIQTTYGVDIGDWHGFWYAFPAILKDNVSHTIYAYSVDTAGGSNAQAWNSPKTLTCAPDPTASVSATPGSITAGNSSTVTWSSTNATACTKSGAWSGAVATSGSTVVSPGSTSTYSITCNNAVGVNSSTVSATVTVVPAPTVSVVASPNSILASQSSTVTWSSTGAVSCTASWAGAVATSGSAVVTPGSSTTYTVTCVNSLGSSANSSATVVVSAAPAATVSLTPASSNIAVGGSQTLTWSSTNATSCTKSGSWSGAVATSGSTTVSPGSTSTYTVTCVNAVGVSSTPASATVTVIPNPTASLSPSSASIAVGGSQTLTWSSTNATSCTKSGSWSGAVATSGSTTVSPGSTSTYTITCTNSVGVVSPAVSSTVTVVPDPTVSLTPAAPMIPTGGSQTLTWSSTNATSCTKSGSWSGAVATSGSTSVNPAVTSTYTMTCTNSVGRTAVTSVTVSVVPPPTLSFWPTASTVFFGGSTNLNWAPANASACTASNGWSGAKNAAGGAQSTGIIFTDTTYTLTCTSAVGSVTQNVTVNMGVSPACYDGLDNDGDSLIDSADPGCHTDGNASNGASYDQNRVSEIDAAAATVTVNVSPSSITSGQTTTVSWSSANATSCTATGGSAGWAGARTVSGSWVSGALLSNTTFSMTCLNSVGIPSTASTATVTVSAPPSPVVTISSSPSTVTNGGSSTITWSTTGAVSCSAPWTASTGTSGSQSVTPPDSTDTTYTMTCLNSVAVSDSKSVTISTKSECADGIDNDGDGLTDYPADPDCPSNVGVTETTTAGFTVAVSPSSVPIKILGSAPATSAISNVTVGVTGGFTSDITFTAVATLPGGVSATYIFAPTNVSTYTAGGYTPVTLQIRLTGNLSSIGKNPIPVTITGVGGGKTVVSTFNLNPNVAPDFKEI